MKNGLIVKFKNILMYINLIWSAAMLVTYLMILFKLSLPILGDLLFIMLLGIWVVPILYVAMITLMIIVHIKYKDYERKKVLTVISAILPIILAAIMILTDFIHLLA